MAIWSLPGPRPI